MVNEIVAESAQFIRSFGFHLPPFAHLSAAEMIHRKKQIGAIIDARLGWDITDYGKGNFDQLGLVLFTLRNGSAENLKLGKGMCYAEKVMISRKDQLSPMHRHVNKTEDIINRGGAKLALQLYISDDLGKLNETGDVSIPCDGILRTLKAGDTLILEPGESVTLHPGIWHSFWGEGGDVLIGEVSTVNNDLSDNIFSERLGRFSLIEEDCTPEHLLVSDYDQWLK